MESEPKPSRSAPVARAGYADGGKRQPFSRRSYDPCPEATRDRCRSAVVLVGNRKRTSGDIRRETVFVVLKEHVIDYAIDREIIRYYPEAIIVELDQTTSGAAETAALGVAALASLGPFAVNDCDHAFSCNGLMAAVARLADGADGALLTFRSSNPAFSYLRLSADGEVVGTIEKQVESANAIGGCYIFANASELWSLWSRRLQSLSGSFSPR
ncbi:glycosyltransferase family protein [Phyllobacterium sp. K27]